jgi:ferredoxin
MEIETRNVKVLLYTDEYNIVVEPDEVILTSAKRDGLEPPFSCQIGACGTCRAKLVSGEITMDECDALTDEEIAEGWILTCQSHPLTDDVVVDYDW